MHSTVPYCIMHALLYYTELNCPWVHSTALHCTLHWTVLTVHFTVLFYTTTLHCTVLHYTALNCSTIYYTALLFTVVHYSVYLSVATPGVSWESKERDRHTTSLQLPTSGNDVMSRRNPQYHEWVISRWRSWGKILSLISLNRVNSFIFLSILLLENIFARKEKFNKVILIYGHLCV